MQTQGNFFTAVQCIKGIRTEVDVIVSVPESKSFMSEIDWQMQSWLLQASRKLQIVGSSPDFACVP